MQTAPTKNLSLLMARNDLLMCSERRSRVRATEGIELEDGADDRKNKVEKEKESQPEFVSKRSRERQSALVRSEPREKKCHLQLVITLVE